VTESQDEPVIRDSRRIDPETGELRGSVVEEPAAPAGEVDEAAVAGWTFAEAAKMQEQLDERTSDLQRLQAEYSNYRKRVERDRVAVKEQALVGVLTDLLPILDDIGRARDHDELSGGFKSVGEALEAFVGKLGLEQFGKKGEPFDPVFHEALMHSTSPDVTEDTCIDVFQPGYRIGERIIRPARVAVVAPQD